MNANEIKQGRGFGVVKKLKDKTQPTGESKFWYILYSVNGRKMRQNTKTTVWQEAYDLLVQRKADAAKGAAPARSQVIFRWEDMRELLISFYKAEGTIMHIGADGESYFRGRTEMDKFFKGMAVSMMDSAKIGQYVKTLEAKGLKGPSIRRQLDCLGKAFTLAKRTGNIAHVPYIQKPAESAPAGKIITPANFKKILAEMPEIYRPLFTFLNATACRVGAARKITWEMVSEDCNVIHVSGEIVKNREPLPLPLKGPQLKPIADMLRTLPRQAGKAVFYSGEIFEKDEYLDIWQAACVKVGMGTYEKNRKPEYIGVRVHDLSVAGVRNMVRAGIPQDIAMKISGKKTPHVFSRYNVCDLSDFEQALEKVGKYVEAA